MEYRVQFHDISLQQFDWCKLDTTSGEVIESGTSDSAQLSVICSGSTKILVFLPQQNILLMAPQLPPKANKQQLNSIAYSIEEYLAEDIEDCFFAVLKQQDDDTVPVAVISADVMDKLTELLSQQHINARLVLPQIYLCPWPGTNKPGESNDDDLLATICPVQEGYLIRTGLHEGMFCQHSVLNQVVTLLEKNKSSDQARIFIYGDKTSDDFISSKLNIEHQEAINLLGQSIDTQSCINLKQKNYESSYQWMGLLKQWQWPMVAAVLLVVFFVAGSVLDGWKKEKIYTEIITQQQNLLKQHLPDLEVSNQPKGQLIKILSNNQGGSGQVGFLDLLHEYAKLKKGFNAVNSEKIIYQQSQLVVNLETSDLNSMESFRVRLEKSNYKVDIENVNINPDKTTGRLVMRDTQ